jgi:hypothetical protein
MASSKPLFNEGLRPRLHGGPSDAKLLVLKFAWAPEWAHDLFYSSESTTGATVNGFRPIAARASETFSNAPASMDC